VTAEHHAAYPIAYHPGMELAKLQAVRGADAPLCAFIAAYAAYYNDPTSIAGTLRNNPLETIEWIREQVAHFQIPLGRAASWARAVNLQRAEFTDEDLADPMAGLTPFPHQLLACRHATVSGLVAALGCGLGKTLTTAVLARGVVRRRLAAPTRLWIFCPLNAFGAWTRYLPELHRIFAEVRVLSNDSDHKYTGVDRASGGVIVFDESHEMGTRTSIRAKAAHQIRAAFDFAICLTGTLLHAGIEKVASILDLAVPGMSLFGTRWKMGEYFNCLVKKQLSSTNTVTALVKPTGEAVGRFHEYVARACISLTLDSPEVVSSIQVPPQEKYDVAFNQPWPKLEDEVVRIVEEILAKEGELPHMQRVFHVLGRQGVEAKIDWLLAQIDGPDTGVVVFANYRDSLDYAGERLTAAGISFVRVDGDVGQADRPALEARFQSGDVQVFLGQTKAAGIAIDLFRAQVSVMLDHSWKAIDYAQALARTRRIGQTAECHHFDLFANDIQKKIISRVRAGADFDAECAEYQAAKRAFARLSPAPATADDDPRYA
jgi:hypothetical protein